MSLDYQPGIGPGVGDNFDALLVSIAELDEGIEAERHLSSCFGFGVCRRAASRFDIRQRGILYAYIGFVDIGFFDLPQWPGSARLWVEPEQYKVVGACLAAARRGRGINQQELAETLGKPQSFISEYERGQRRVDVVELLMIARALGIEPLDLFTEITAALPK